MKCRYVMLFFLFSLKAGAQVRWTGLSSNGLWGDPSNWESGIMPGVNDDVLLDNSLLAGSYTVRLPDFAITVRSLSVLASVNNSITVELPLSNVLTSPSGSLLDRAFTTTANGYSLVLGNGAVFINASGSNSGYSLRLNDSIRVNNGGRYIHRTRTGHADIVQSLSKAPGTERGIFRFENPDAASTISLSGRVFGSLHLSAAGNILGTVSYSASGTNPVTVRGDLVLNPGATLAINFDDTISVAGSLLMDNAVFNMATGNRSSVLVLEGNWQQNAGLISESNTQQKTGTITLKGKSRQVISCTGMIKDSIIIDINNPAGVQLLQPLRCSYGLRLTKGAIASSSQQMLSIAPSAWIQADSTAGNNFVDGPLKKEGLVNAYFLFPVGRNNHLRWLALRNASGDQQVEYHPESASIIGSSMGAGLDHISKLEYWSVISPGTGSGQVELSYDNVLSGGVSELVSLRVASFVGAAWTDAGNLATSGFAYLNGSVTSGDISGLGTSVQYLTLASSSSFTNVLPLLITDQWMDYNAGCWAVNWKVEPGDEISVYAVELSVDGKHFTRIGYYPASQGQQYFRGSIPVSWQTGFARIAARNKNGTEEYGKVLRFGNPAGSQGKIELWYNSPGNTIQIEYNKSRLVKFELFDASGRCINRGQVQLKAGITTIPLHARNLPNGIYWIRVTGDNGILVMKQLFL